jgi:hypothetical protein
MHRAHHRSYNTLEASEEETGINNSPWNDANDTAPAKPYSAAVEQAHIKPISPTFDLRQDLPIVLRYAWW